MRRAPAEHPAAAVEWFDTGRPEHHALVHTQRSWRLLPAATMLIGNSTGGRANAVNIDDGLVGFATERQCRLCAPAPSGPCDLPKLRVLAQRAEVVVQVPADESDVSQVAQCA